MVRSNQHPALVHSGRRGECKYINPRREVSRRARRVVLWQAQPGSPRDEIPYAGPSHPAARCSPRPRCKRHPPLRRPRQAALQLTATSGELSLRDLPIQPWHKKPRLCCSHGPCAHPANRSRNHLKFCESVYRLPSPFHGPAMRKFRPRAELPSRAKAPPAGAPPSQQAKPPHPWPFR